MKNITTFIYNNEVAFLNACDVTKLGSYLVDLTWDDKGLLFE